MIPLVVVDGLIQRISSNDRLKINRLNIGEWEDIVATSDIITVSRSFIRLRSASLQDVSTILGGKEGDILIVFGNNVRLRRTRDGNLKLRSNTLLNSNRSTLLAHTGSFWVQPGGN